MSKIEVDAIEPQSGTSLTLGASGDTITIPSGATLTNSGTATGFGGGKVLQVVEGTSVTSVSTSSSTYVTTGLSASITPSATSSKVLVICNFTAQQDTSGNAARFTIIRGVTDIDPATDGFAKLRVGAANLFGNVPMTTLDTPSTTSSTTYTAHFKTGSGAAEAMAGGSSGRMILIEIGV
jgi:hypothetical protein